MASPRGTVRFLAERARLSAGPVLGAWSPHHRVGPVELARAIAPFGRRAWTPPNPATWMLYFTITALWLSRPDIGRWRPAIWRLSSNVKGDWPRSITFATTVVLRMVI